MSRSEDSLERLQNGAVRLIRGRGYALDAPAGAAPVSETLGVVSYDGRSWSMLFETRFARRSSSNTPAPGDDE